jgi:hypothetical protein
LSKPIDASPAFGFMGAQKIDDLERMVRRGIKGMEPKSSEGPQAEGDLPSGASARKPKPAIEFDLPADAIKSVDSSKEEPAIEPVTSAAELNSSPKRGSFGLVAAIGLVAGLVGGAGGSQIMNSFDSRVTTLAGGLDQRLSRLESVRPAAIPPELNDRLQRVEQLSNSETEKLRDALQAEQAERSRAVAALAERLNAGTNAIAVPLAPGQDVVPEIERFKSRLEALESTLRPLPDALAALAQRQAATSARLDSFTPRFEELAKTVDGVKPEVSALGERMAGLSRGFSGLSHSDEMTRSSAKLVAVQFAGEALARNEALGPLVETLRGLGVEAGILEPLTSFASVAPPSLGALAADLRNAASQTEPAEKRASGDLLERLKAGAASLVDIRRTGEITGTDDAAHIGRAEQAILRGDLTAAANLLARLTPQRAPAFAEVKQKITQRHRASDAIARLRRESLERLNQAATGR